MLSVRWLGVFALCALTAQAHASGFASPKAAPRSGIEKLEDLHFAARRSCKAMSSCEEAVQAWCSGYKDADRDRDGIPCENVCRSVAQVEAIKAKIGC